MPDGSDLTITIETASGQAEADTAGPFSDLAGSWVGLVDCDRLLADVYASRATPSERPVVQFPEVVYLIDTDWLIQLFNGRAAFVRELNRLAPDGLAVSVITLAELWEGVRRARYR